jgi:putative transposase
VRTIKRVSEVINIQKWRAIKAIASAYAKEKNYWLDIFQQKKSFKNIKRHREIRNQAVLNQYQSPYKLQARMWKLALIDAAETMDKYWRSIFEKIKSVCITHHQ